MAALGGFEYGGTFFAEVQTSSFQIKDLRFGDFDGNGTTDVFGVEDGHWQRQFQPESSARIVLSSWTPLQAELTSTVDGLWVADSNGDGIADVAANCGGDCWQISIDGRGGWSNFHLGTPISVAAIGYFEGKPAAEQGIRIPADLILSWSANDLWISVGGMNPLVAQSSQEMR